MSDLAYADDTILLSNNYAIEHHTTIVCIRINVSKNKVVSELITDEQCQALEDADKFNRMGCVFITNGQGTEDVRGVVKFTRSPFFCSARHS